MHTVNKIIQRLGKKDYKVDASISKKDMIIILEDKLMCLIRGFWVKLWLKKSKGTLLVGRRCKIRHCEKIEMGKMVFISDNVEINALSKYGIVIGDNVSIHRNTIIECTGVLRELGEGLTVGSNVGIAQNCFIQVRGFVSIGSNVMFAPNVSIFSENHSFGRTDIPMIDQPTIREGIVIEDDVWLGTHSIVLDGVTIGKGSIIAAGAIVNNSVPPYSVVAGIPGKVIKSRI